MLAFRNLICIIRLATVKSQSGIYVNSICSVIARDWLGTELLQTYIQSTSIHSCEDWRGNQFKFYQFGIQSWFDSILARNAKPFHFIGTSPLPLIQPSSYAQSSSKDQSDTSASRQISCPSCAMKNYESSCRHRQDGAADEVHPFGKSNRSQHTIHCRWSDTGPEDEYVQITPCSYIRFVVELPSIQWMKWTGNHYSIILRNVLVKLLFFCPKDSRSYCFWLYLENVRCIINIVGVYKWKKTSKNI